MRLLIIFLLAMPLMPLLHGDGEHELRFVSLERYEERNKLLLIRKGMNDELAAMEDRTRRIDAMEAKLYVIAEEKDTEKRLLEYLKLRRSVKDMQSGMKASNDKQVELAGLVDVATVSSGNLPQVEVYLSDARQQLRKLGENQAVYKKRLENILKGIAIAVRSVPAPREYMTDSGIKMFLVRGYENSFYISAAPLCNGGVTLADASAIIKKISLEEGERYRLPELSELEFMKKVNMSPTCAVWTGTKMEGQNIEQDRIFLRFGVNMYYIWDNKGDLHRGEVFGELPFAKYDALGVYVATDVNTGKKKRWGKILGKLSRELDAAGQGKSLETDK